MAMVTASQNVVPLSSPLYEDMELLYLLKGKSIPSGGKPWTDNQASLYLKRIAADSLKGPEAALYDEIVSELDRQKRWDVPGGFTFGVWMDLSAEMYSHTNSTDFHAYTDWTYRFTDRKPLARLRMNFTVDPFFSTYCDLQYGYGLYTSEDTLTKYDGSHVIGALVPSEDKTKYSDLVLVDGSSVQKLYTQNFSNNLILKSRDFDFQWPKRAILSLGGSNWNFNFGRDRLDWGNSHIGNMVLDDHADFHDYARFVTFSPYFTYEALSIFPDWGYQYQQDSRTFRVFLLHRLEFRPAEKVTFTLSENVMYKDSVFQLQYLNPSFLYHNLNVRDKFNAIAYVDASYAFLPGWNLYGQFALDQAVAPNEDKDAESNAWGGLGGIEWIGVCGKGILRTALEGAFTLPCMYRRDGIDFIYSRRYAGLNDSQGGSWNAQLFDYFGFPYGGDAVVVKWDSKWKVPQKGSLSMAVTLLLHGPMDMYVDVVGSSGLTSYGTTMFKGGSVDASLFVTFCGCYQLPKVNFLESWGVYGEAAFIEKTHYDATTKTSSDWRNDLQLTIGITTTI